MSWEISTKAPGTQSLKLCLHRYQNRSAVVVCTGEGDVGAETWVPCNLELEVNLVNSAEGKEEGQEGDSHSTDAHPRRSVSIATSHNTCMLSHPCSLPPVLCPDIRYFLL